MIDTPGHIEDTTLIDACGDADRIILCRSPEDADLYRSVETAQYIDRNILDVPRGVLFNRTITRELDSREWALEEFADAIGWQLITPSIPRRKYISKLHTE